LNSFFDHELYPHTIHHTIPYAPYTHTHTHTYIYIYIYIVHPHTLSLYLTVCDLVFVRDALLKAVR
jgi:hypothetical protein